MAAQVPVQVNNALLQEAIDAPAPAQAAQEEHPVPQQNDDLVDGQAQAPPPVEEPAAELVGV